MAVRFYDEALVNKIQEWVKDPNMKVLKPDEVTRLFQIQADYNKDEPLTLPLIAISREPSITSSSGIWVKKPITFDGFMLEATEKSTKQLNAIGIVIRYQIDIFTKEYAIGDEYFRNLLFNLINFPDLKVVIPYNNTDYESTAHIKVMSPANDNSDIPQRLFPGEFTRWTITLEIPDAYLYGIPVVNNVHLAGIELVMTDESGTEQSEPEKL